MYAIRSYYVLTLHNGIQQTFFEQTFSDRRGTFVDQLEQREFIPVFWDDGELLECVIAKNHIALTVDDLRPWELLDNMIIMLNDKVDSYNFV